MWISGREFAVDGSQPVAALPRIGRATRTVSLLAWLRERVTTTPGRLVLVSISVIVGAVCFGVIATVAERSRAQAAQAARTETEPLLVQAVTLYTALSDANATANTTFLTGGLEQPARRAHYLQDLRLASDSLATLTREVGGSADARVAVGTITEQLPIFSGLVEAARANNRQGLPVGAAYLRQASGRLTGTILPEADRLYAIEAKRLTADYGTGTAAAALVVLGLVIGLALALLVLAQLYLARISRRILNIPTFLATVVLAAVSIWAVVGLIGEQNALASARRGSDAVEVLSATRVLLSRAQSDQSLTLVNRGSDETDPADFAAVMRELAPNGGLLGGVSALARRTATSAPANRLTAEFASYQAETTQITMLESNGRILDAIKRASAASSSSIADRLNAGLAGQITTAQGRFMSAAGAAASSLSGLSVAIPVLTALAAALALIGLRQRLSEYR
jgi:hypothetical protein